MALAHYAVARRTLETLIEQALGSNAQEMGRAAAQTRIGTLDDAYDHYKIAHAEKLETETGDWEPMHATMDNFTQVYIEAKTVLTAALNRIEEDERNFDRA